MIRTPSTVRAVALALGAWTMACGPQNAPLEAPVSTEAHPLSSATEPVAREDAGAPKESSSTVTLGAGQVWEGRYGCAQGETEGLLRVVRVTEHELQVVFEFEHAATGVTGSYKMHGLANGTNVLLQGTEWIHQPSGYVMVALTGAITGSHLDGTVIGPGCSTFSFRLRKGSAAPKGRP